MLTAVVIVAAGVVVALIGFVFSARSTRRSVTAAGPTTRADIAVAVVVVGLVASIFGGGYLAFLLLTTG